ERRPGPPIDRPLAPRDQTADPHDQRDPSPIAQAQHSANLSDQGDQDEGGPSLARQAEAADHRPAGDGSAARSMVAVGSTMRTARSAGEIAATAARRRLAVGQR